MKTRLKKELASEVIAQGNIAAATLFAKPTTATMENTEFIFVIDCSGSMWGPRIEKAGKCLDIFIRSLPQQSFFNVIRFGTSFTPLFKQSQEYSRDSTSKALQLAKDIAADMRDNNLKDTLNFIYKSPMKGKGVRQVFF
jgi:cobalamin biosynthesis protein CobT